MAVATERAVRGGRDVRVTGLEAIPVRLPYRVPWENLHTRRAGARREWLDAVVLRLRAGDLEGLGEVPGGRDAARAIVEQAQPVLRGASPFEPGPTLARLEAALGSERAAWRAGVEFALHDLAGKALGVPLYQLLGGRVRQRVPLAYTMGMRPLDQLAAEARRAADGGFRHCIKLKLGAGEDLDYVLAVARAVPGVPVRPDSNMGHDRATAARSWGRCGTPAWPWSWWMTPARSTGASGPSWPRRTACACPSTATCAARPTCSPSSGTGAGSPRLTWTPSAGACAASSRPPGRSNTPASGR